MMSVWEKSLGKVGDIRHLLVLGIRLQGTKKGETTLPGTKKAASPHGYWTLFRRYVPAPKRRSGGKNKKDRTSCRVGHGKGDGDACGYLGDFRVPEAGRDVKGGDLLYVFDSPVNASDHVYNPRLTGYPKDKEQQAKTYITNYTRPKPSQKTFPPWGL